MCHFLATLGHLLDRNGCHGITMTCGIPLPNYVNVAKELIWTMIQFGSKLNPCPCLILTIIARQLLIFAPISPNLGAIFTDNGVFARQTSV